MARWLIQRPGTAPVSPVDTAEPRPGWARARWVATSVASLGLLLAQTQCSKGTTTLSELASAARAKPVVYLPAPFSDVKLGMTQAELEAKFPPTEDISRCEPLLVGGDAPMPVAVPGADKKARSQCARSGDISGATMHDIVQITSTEKDLAGDTEAIIEAEFGTLAQVRGAVRAGAVPEAAILQADHGHSATAGEAVTNVTDALFRGGFAFATSKKARRERCAVIADSCDDLDPTRVRKYVEGGYSLRQIDADARSRVEYSKCRGPYIQHEKALGWDFARRAGALGGIGLARASRPDRHLNPDDASTFAVYSSRSSLDAAPAKLGVLIANALPEVERYWSGAVGLRLGALGDAGDAVGFTAVVWLRHGHVVRAMLNVLKDDKVGDLPKTLADFYGSPGKSAGTVTKWTLGDGSTVTLDIGAATSVVVESKEAAAQVTTRPSESAAPAASTSAAPASSAAGVVSATPSAPAAPHPATAAPAAARHAARPPVPATVPSGPQKRALYQ
jgi:hypothetical protein